MTDLYTLAKVARDVNIYSLEYAKFHAAATPEAIIELCERVETLQKKLDNANKVHPLNPLIR